MISDTDMYANKTKLNIPPFSHSKYSIMSHTFDSHANTIAVYFETLYIVCGE